MAGLRESLEKLGTVEGFIGACVVDSNSGMMLGSKGGGDIINLELAAAGNTEVVRSKRETMKKLNLQDTIEDILISLQKQYHLIRPMALTEGIFIYLVLDRSRSNLALARHTLTEVESKMEL